MKYKLTENTKVVENTKLYQIQRLLDGALGGWIESEANLSQEGNCWVYDNACVYGNARVYSNAWVFGNAQVCIGKVSSLSLSSREKIIQIQAETHWYIVDNENYRILSSNKDIPDKFLNLLEQKEITQTIANRFQQILDD